MIPYVLTADEDEERLARGMADVGTLQVARLYAEALLNAAEQAGQVHEVIEDFEALLSQVEVPRSLLRAFFASGVVGRRVRGEVLRKVFEGRCHPLLLNFLLVLNDHDRTPILPAVLFELKELRDRRAGRLPVFVHAAVPPTDEQLRKIEQLVRERLQFEPVVEVKVDPDLLGGLMMRIGDHVFDGTVRTQLKQLRDYLISRSSYEIQSGRDRFSSPSGN